MNKIYNTYKSIIDEWLKIHECNLDKLNRVDTIISCRADLEGVICEELDTHGVKSKISVVGPNITVEMFTVDFLNMIGSYM